MLDTYTIEQRRIWVGLRIRQVRKDQKMTQLNLARLCGLKNRTTICELENGKRNPTFELLLNVSRALEIDMGTLFLDYGKKPYNVLRNPYLAADQDFYRKIGKQGVPIVNVDDMREMIHKNASESALELMKSTAEEEWP